jgi:hypothetical protein
MIFWGSGHKTIRKSLTGYFVCPGCGRKNCSSVVVDYDYQHIYWLFKSVKNVQASLVCDNCAHAQGPDDQRQSDLFEKLGGNPIPFMHRFGAHVLVLMFVLLVAFSYLSKARRDDSGVIVNSGRIDAFEIQLGDCYDDSADDDEGTEVFGVDAVSCAQLHDNEVFAVFDLDLKTFPEGDAMGEIAFDECIQRFEPFVGRDYPSSSLDITLMYPTQQTWNELKDREVLCALYDIELNKLQGSMRDSGM